VNASVASHVHWRTFSWILEINRPLALTCKSEEKGGGGGEGEDEETSHSPGAPDGLQAEPWVVVVEEEFPIHRKWGGEAF